MGSMLERLEQMTPERRSYALLLLVQHLYDTKEWTRLFVLLDAESYGQAKLQYDPSTRSYVQDLNLGCQAVTWIGWTLEEGIELLPRLWRYLLIRSGLRSRADQYPPALFHLLLLLKQEAKVLGLTELVTKPRDKVWLLLQNAKHLYLSNRQSESLRMFVKAYEVAASLDDPTGAQGKVEALNQLSNDLLQARQQRQQAENRAWALGQVALGLAQTQQWQRAHEVWNEAQAVARSIANSSSHALSELANVLAQARQWQQAEVVARSIEESDGRAEALRELASCKARLSSGSVSLYVNSSRTKEHALA